MNLARELELRVREGEFEFTVWKSGSGWCAAKLSPKAAAKAVVQIFEGVDGVESAIRAALAQPGE